MCPALNLLICPECCREKRAKIPGCDQQCRYYTPLIYVGKINPPPDLPIYQCLVSKSRDSGMLTVIVARERPDGNLKTMVLLLDLWKKGIRDCFVDANLSKAALRHLCMKLGQSYHLAEQPPIDMSQEQVKSKEHTPPEKHTPKEKVKSKEHTHSEKHQKKIEPAEQPFEQIGFTECQKLIRHAWDIAKGVKTEIPWGFQYWRDMLGDLSKVPKMEGSLYKCPKCGGDLPQSAVDLIKQHAQSDDIQFYIVCRKCGGEFD